VFCEAFLLLVCSLSAAGSEYRRMLKTPAQKPMGMERETTELKDNHIQ
jgi:hypothetical protein